MDPSIQHSFQGLASRIITAASHRLKNNWRSYWIYLFYEHWAYLHCCSFTAGQPRNRGHPRIGNFCKNSAIHGIAWESQLCHFFKKTLDGLRIPKI